MSNGIRARFFYLHPSVNAGKLAALDSLQAAYTPYLRECVETMIAGRRFTVPLGERRTFFPPSVALSSQIAKNAQAHAVAIVSGWAASLYETKLRSYIRSQHKAGAIADSMRAALFVVGKKAVETPADAPNGIVTQAAIDLYWTWLGDEKIAGRPPTVTDRCGMRMSEMTCVLGANEAALARDGDERTRLTAWWLGFAHLNSGKRWIKLPLVANPYVKTPSDVSKGVLARKKNGRWRFEVVEKEEVRIPSAKGLPVIGIDVGLNVMVATSDGLLLGGDIKPKFNRLYVKVRDLRKNRQRQGLRENSPRLARMEERLTGLVKSAAGYCANELVRRYPDHAFVVEDLDLRGCRGQKRYAYRATHHALGQMRPILPKNPAYTSQECPSCGYVHRGNRHGIVFICRSCGRKAHADVVGARNLLGRSEDKQIGRDDTPSEVKAVLRARYHRRRWNSASAGSYAPAPSGRRLTVRVRARIASNQVD